MITFNRLIIENFRSFRGAFTIELANQGLVFIVGENQSSEMADSNGSGKTSIFEAICLVLYNKMLRAGTAVNRESTWAAVTLLFSIAEKPYIAKWEQNKGKKSWTVSEMVVGVAEHSHLGGEIETLLGLSFNAFVSTLMFGTSSDRFAEQSDAPRKKMFDDLLDTTFFLEKRLAVEQELKVFDDRYTQLDVELVKLTERRTILQGERDRFGQDTEALEIEAYREWAAKQDVRLEMLKTLNDLFPLVMTARREMATEQALVDESTQLVAIRSRLEQQISDVEERVRRLMDRFESILKSKVCPMCHRPIESVATVDTYFQNEIRPLTARRREALAYRDDVQAILESWPALDPGRSYHTLKAQFESLQDRVMDHERVMSQIEEARFMRQAVDDLSERLEQTERDIAALMKSRDAVKADITLREFWIEGFGNRGLKARLISDYEQFLNTKLALYSGLIAAGEFILTFTGQRQLKGGEVRDEIGFTIQHAGATVAYDDLSDGERQRVDLCVVLALQDLVRDLHRGRFSLALYDEIFDHLDDTGCEQVMAYLTQQRREYGSVFVISHSPKLLSYQSDHVIRVVKTEKGSAIHAQ